MEKTSCQTSEPFISSDQSSIVDSVATTGLGDLEFSVLTLCYPRTNIETPRSPNFAPPTSFVASIFSQIIPMVHVCPTDELTSPPLQHDTLPFSTSPTPYAHVSPGRNVVACVRILYPSPTVNNTPGEPGKISCCCKLSRSP